MLHLLPAQPTPPRASRGSADGIDPTLLAQPVLVVEDEAMIAWTMETMLEELGFTDITIAPSGEAAIEQARRVPPRLIVSDINLGPQRMDGAAAAVAILEATAASVVFVTGNATGDARRRIGTMLPGAVLLAKPVGLPDLARGIAGACAPPE